MAESKSDSPSEHDTKEPGKVEAMLGVLKPHHQEKEAHSSHDSIDESTAASKVKAPNIFDQAKEEIDAIAQTIHQKKESSSEGSLPMDESSKVELERGWKAKEEFHAIVHKDRDEYSEVTSEPQPAKSESSSGTDGKFHSSIGKAKEEFHAIVHRDRDDNSEATSEPQPASSESSPGRHGKTHQLVHRTKEELKSLLHKEKSPKEHHVHHKETHGTSGTIDENTPLSDVKAPSVFGRAKEELEALVETVHHTKKEPVDRPLPPPHETEDRCECVLARGLQKLCAPWTRKSEE